MMGVRLLLVDISCQTFRQCGGNSEADEMLTLLCMKETQSVLETYLDESGHDNRLLLIAGLVSEAARWVLFTNECERIKAHFKIPYIHATELLNLKKRRLYGHLTANERSQLLGTLLSAIRDHAEFSLCSAVIPVEYNSITTPEWRARNGTAYSLCVSGVLIGLAEWLKRVSRQSHLVRIILEDGHAHSGEAVETVTGFKTSTDDLDLPTIGDQPTSSLLKIGCLLGTKATMPPLWAADLVAYCTYDQIIRRDEWCAEIMDTLEDRVPSFGVSWDEEKIKFFVAKSIEMESGRREWEAETHNLVKYLYREHGILARKHSRGVILDFSEMTSNQRQRFLEGESADNSTKLE